MFDLSSYEKLPQSFYNHSDVVHVAKELLGKYVFTNIDGIITAGKIVETEAYCGRNDRACHAHAGRTERTRVMFEKGGVAYVYLCYGIHHLFNVVSNEEGLADAVLIRAVEPVLGMETMHIRRGSKVPFSKLTAGPGTLSKALGIQKKHNALDLCGDTPEELEIEATTRVGVGYAGEDALLPWRFYIRDHPFVSVKKRNP
ncbi:DNA-3-methyladenine glycosylase [Marinoscillum sp. 108]|uniref:DNA-3-methyladenine glycosylase n=1 Tax=Marinoscillum sp. 108 TaxID=2653151 RepID=UPI0012F232C9|nr:DNA-3-methyladenine glycosylase [Marinoscillum sp. 108]VXD15833.1 putative 3-methyladenine DNA glycosylase [Marinoscillum sp. 108]